MSDETDKQSQPEAPAAEPDPLSLAGQLKGKIDAATREVSAPDDGIVDGTPENSQLPIKAKKRGRPEVSAMSFFRAAIIIEAYDRARTSGIGYKKSMEEALHAVRREAPHLPISLTEVKRTLAIYRPRDTLVGFTVVKESGTPTLWHLKVDEFSPIYRKLPKRAFSIVFSRKFRSKPKKSS